MGELDEYLSALATFCKVVVFHEPWYPRHALWNPFTVTRPEDVPASHPYMAGVYGNYHHNYPEHLARHGFRTVRSEIVAAGTAAETRGHYALRLVAENGAV